MSFTDGLFSRALSAIPEARMLATVKESTNLNVSNFELVYRIMILDLVSLIENTLSSDKRMTSLTLTVATRTREGVRMSDEQSIEAVLRESASSLESGLAARGLIEVMRNGIKPSLVQANACWGTIVADFLANTVLNRRHAEQSDLIDNLLRRKSLHVFESFGGYEERRARVAVRDGDLVTGLCRWLSLDAKPRKNATKVLSELPARREEEVDRLLKSLLDDPDPTKAGYTIDSLLQRFHLQGDRASSRALQRLVDALNTLHAPSGLMMRVENYRLLVANRNGDDAATLPLSNTLDNLTAAALDPDNLPEALKYRRHRLNMLENRLAFDQALKEAVRYRELVERYQDVWTLLQPTNEGEQAAQAAFASSRTMIVARHLVARHQILCSTLESHSLHETLSEIQRLLPLCETSQDRQRIQTTLIQGLLKAGRWSEAWVVTRTLLTVNSRNPYNVFWAMRTWNDSRLAGASVEPIDIIDINFIDVITHPGNLVCRELRLSQRLLGEPVSSQTPSFPNTSPSGRWLDELNQIHESLFAKRRLEPPKWQIPPPILDVLDGSLSKASGDHSAALLRLRVASPY